MRAQPAILAASLILPALTLARAGDDPLPAPQEILARYVDGAGGEEAIMAKRHVSWKGTLEMPGLGIGGTIELRASAPNLFYMEIVSEGLGSITQGYNGEVAWVDNPMTGPMVLEGGELEAFIAQADFHAELNYERNYASLGPVTREDFDETPCYKLRVTSPGGIEGFHYFSISSGLLVAVTGNQPTPMGDVYVVSRIGSYEELGGRLYPTESRQQMMGAEQVIVLEEADFAEIDSAVFDLPKSIQTLLATATDDTGEDPP